MNKLTTCMAITATALLSISGAAFAAAAPCSTTNVASATSCLNHLANSTASSADSEFQSNYRTEYAKQKNGFSATYIPENTNAVLKTTPSQSNTNAYNNTYKNDVNNNTINNNINSNINNNNNSESNHSSIHWF